jgi:hypothetical protein
MEAKHGVAVIDKGDVEVLLSTSTARLKLSMVWQLQIMEMQR